MSVLTKSKEEKDKYDQVIITIGILAFNEAESIERMIKSLFRQNILQEAQSQYAIEIIVVPNGCNDETALIAREVLADLTQDNTVTNLSYLVHEVKQPGKSNAWNILIHELSNPKTDYIFVMDTDIELIHQSTLQSMIETLQKDSQAQVTVDKPIKDIFLKKRKNLTEKFSLSISKLSGFKARENEAAWICGQLYCSRAAILRRIWLPVNLLVEDGFLYNAIVTNLWQSPPQPNKVILASKASHSFVAYTNIFSLLRHEIAVICGNAVNDLIAENFVQNKNQVQNIGQLIRQRNEQNSHWVNDLIQTRIAEKGWWLIPRFILIRRFLSLQNKPIGKSVLLFPLALASFFLDLILSIKANFDLSKGYGLNYWRE